MPRLSASFTSIIIRAAPLMSDNDVAVLVKVLRK